MNLDWICKKEAEKYDRNQKNYQDRLYDTLEANTNLKSYRKKSIQYQSNLSVPIKLNKNQ